MRHLRMLSSIVRVTSVMLWLAQAALPADAAELRVGAATASVHALGDELAANVVVGAKFLTPHESCHDVEFLAGKRHA